MPVYISKWFCRPNAPDYSLMTSQRQRRCLNKRFSKPRRSHAVLRSGIRFLYKSAGAPHFANALLPRHVVVCPHSRTTQAIVEKQKLFCEGSCEARRKSAVRHFAMFALWSRPRALVWSYEWDFVACFI